MNISYEDMKDAKIINFFLVENNNDTIFCGVINWDKNLLSVNGDEFEGSIKDFFNGISSSLGNGVYLYLSKIDAMNRSLNSFNIILEKE